jgi:hypothetical protein
LVYSSELTENGQTYSRNCRISNYYYETIQMNVVTAGFYSISGKSPLDIYGYIYKDNFNPLNPFENLYSQNGFSCDGRQFTLTTNLQIGTAYVLVVTTFYPNETGAFSIFVSGPDNISLNRTSEYMHCLVNNQHRSTKYRKYL